MNHRIFERTLRSLVFRGARLFECREALKLVALLSTVGLDMDFAAFLRERLVLNALADPCFVDSVLLNVISINR